MQLTAVLDTLRTGEFAPSPVRVRYAYMIPLKLDPDFVPEDKVPVFQLPSDVVPNIDAVFSRAEGKRIAPYVKQIAKLLETISMSDEERTVVRDALAKLVEELSAAENSDVCVLAYRRAMKSIHRRVSAATYSRVTDTVERAVTDFLSSGKPMDTR